MLKCLQCPNLIITLILSIFLHHKLEATTLGDMPDEVIGLIAAQANKQTALTMRLVAHRSKNAVDADALLTIDLSTHERLRGFFTQVITADQPTILKANLCLRVNAQDKDYVIGSLPLLAHLAVLEIIGQFKDKDSAREIEDAANNISVTLQETRINLKRNG